MTMIRIVQMDAFLLFLTFLSRQLRAGSKELVGSNNTKSIINVSFNITICQHYQHAIRTVEMFPDYRPVGGFGVENVFLSLLAGTLLDLLLAEPALELLSVSSSPLPETYRLIKPYK